MENLVYFTDQFFSAGRTMIYNESQEKTGELDLKSIFNSSVCVEDINGKKVVEGGFPFFSGKWAVKRPDGTELGRVSTSFSFFSKRYKYKTAHGDFSIESPPFSKEYSIMNRNENVIATFRKVSGFFQAAAFELKNASDTLMTEELIAVVMGVNQIEKRRRSSSASVNAPT
ncbi:hypothetical protein [Peribacillus sp. SCS-37]|uniref:hypothetical protein n=1 Tax=Paraperibacillus esterisolvens TaxID=3115296 RepID=UPI00390602D2